MIGIYKITSPTGKIYIGQAVDIGKRQKSYKNLKCKGQPRLYSSLAKYGFSEHIFEVLEQCTIEQLNERERYWQDHYDVLSENGLNCKLTKVGDKSGALSKESSLRISTTMKERGYCPPSRRDVEGYWKGKERPKEANQKTSEKLKGIKRGPRSGEAKDKQKQSMLGKKPWNKGITYTQKNQRKGTCVLNVVTGKVYESIKQASIEERVTRDMVTYSCKKTQFPYKYYS